MSNVTPFDGSSFKGRNNSIQNVEYEVGMNGNVNLVADINNQLGASIIASAR